MLLVFSPKRQTCIYVDTCKNYTATSKIYTQGGIYGKKYGYICRERTDSDYKKGSVVVMDNSVAITLLGDFSIETGGVKISSDQLSPQLCAMLGYLTLHRERRVPIAEMSDILWDDGVASPSASVKNLIYRLRKTLDSLGFPYAWELVISIDGTYAVNNCFELDVDIERIQNLYIQAKTAEPIEKKIQLCDSIFSTYCGDFMKLLSKSRWVVPYSEKYKTIFEEVQRVLLAYYRATEQHDNVLRVATKVVEFSRYDEEAHRMIISAYYAKCDYKKAIHHYNMLRDIFYKERGMELSHATIAVFDEISRTLKASNLNLHVLVDELQKADTVNRAPLYCEYEVFKRLYHFMERIINRASYSVYLALVTLRSTNGEEIAPSTREKGMERLNNVISNSLRSADIFTKCSPTQYALILSLIDYENAMKVMERIDRNFRKEYHTRKVHVLTAITVIEPRA